MDFSLPDRLILPLNRLKYKSNGVGLHFAKTKINDKFGVCHHEYKILAINIDSII